MNNLESRLSNIETKLGLGQRQYAGFIQHENKIPHYFVDGQKIEYSAQAFPEDLYDVYIFSFQERKKSAEI